MKNFDIVFSILALREVEYFGRVSKILKEDGYKVGFVTFHEAGDRLLDKMKIPYLSMQKASRKRTFRFNKARIDEVEKSYGIESIRKTIVHDQAYKPFLTEDEHVSKTLKYLAILDDYFSKNNIRCVIQELGGFIANQTVYYAAKKNKIDHIAIEPSMYSGRIIFNLNSLNSELSDNLNITEQAYAESNRRAEEYCSNGFVNIPVKDTHHFKDMGFLKLFAGKNFKKLFNKIYYKYISRDKEEYDAIYSYVMQNIKKLIRRKFLSPFYSYPNESEKYVYYPLHVPNDFQLFVRSPEFKNQESFIKYLGDTIPFGYKLYVKEHPAAIGANKYLATLSYLKNKYIKLIHPKINSHTLIQNSSAVITVNSKVGVEAIMQRKPVVVVGNAFYKGKGVTYDVDRLSELSGAIKAAIGGKMDEEFRRSFLARAYESSYAGELYVNSQAKVEEFTNSVLSFVRKTVFTKERTGRQG